MAKKMLIDATHAEETRVVVVDGNKVEEFDFETVNKRQLAGNIYLAKVTRVEPSLQAAFVDYGGNRHGFLAFSEIHPDYYQIPVADRKALLAEEKAYAEAMDAEENTRSRRRRPDRRAEEVRSADPVATSEEIPGMSIVDLSEDEAPVEVVETGEGEAPAEVTEAPARTEDATEDQDGEASDGAAGDEPYVAADHAADADPEIESVAEEDVAEEIRQPRKPRPRKYKIQEVVKVRQIMLVQVVKEERGNKGAALTTYLSLAGRYCVLMPNTARGGGISRKITNAADRKKLKEIATEIDVPEGMGLIIRTAGSQRTKTEIKRDYEYLMRLWEQIRDLTLKSVAPAPIYEEGDLIKRSIRDLYNKDIDEVLVEGDKGYRAAKDFMKMIMPSHAKNVKHYTEALPLFARYQVESYLAGMFNPVVQLKSGGYIVIGVTEALVAIDVNSGRATKEGSIEETALKTNLEAADEVARQLRLRDLAGLIVIDFIDMEERKNNAAVEKRLKERLKTDRARIQVGRISGFGLLEMSRQRLRPGMLESTTQPCAHCHGTGIIRSDDSLALQILRQLEEEGTRKRSREVLLKAPIAVVNFLMNQKREHIAQIEARYGLSVRVEADPTLVSPDYAIEKFKTATRFVPEVQTPVVSVDATLMPEIEEEEEEDLEVEVDEAEEEAAPAPAAQADGEPGRKKKRRRRRRRKGGNGDARAADGAEAAGEGADDETAEDEGEAANGAEAVSAAEAAPEAAEAPVAPEKPKSRRSRSRKSAKAEEVAPASDEAAASEAPAAPEAEVPAEATEEAPAKPKRTRKPKAAPKSEGAEEAKPARTRKPRAKAKPAEEAAESAATPAAAEQTAAPEPEAQPAPVAETEPEPQPEVAAQPEPMAQPEPEPVAQPALEPASAEAGLQPDPEEDASSASDPDKPRRRGWWSLGR
ncbi:Rne/Rng family ribonuclease [Albidovulum sediminicola]|uniref:Ribonuclease E n=1 Tax=Albidovulum sediminicola TaxID=2984331 RepID=A0ABT2YZ69_9RHOB|nr:Rne/Rng family ribonuclease [Defluviimonas sp. WL0075]MCV2864173.1 Rne/Rng family ribonuclease [Defluviimonas sp. WL0075]